MKRTSIIKGRTMFEMKKAKIYKRKQKKGILAIVASKIMNKIKKILPLLFVTGFSILSWKFFGGN